MRTQVAIIGSGPSGLILGQILTKMNIANVVIDQVSQDYILQRIRAGVLEQGTVRVLENADVATRMHQEGLVHNGIRLTLDDNQHRIDLKSLTNQHVLVYGQSELTRDLMAARAQSTATSIYQAEQVAIADFDGDHPQVTLVKAGQTHRIRCDFIAGCDGFHGVCRKSIPSAAISEYEKIYPAGWLGLLADVPPVQEELIYAAHPRGFALCSMRSMQRSRYYLQCATDDHVDRWSDTAFWDELRRRLPADIAEQVITGPSIEKSIAQLRAFVSEPIRFGRLFLAGDAAHIVPPTGAKGLNLAASDIHYLSSALVEYYQEHSTAGIDHYSQQALARIWKCVRFSWWMTMLTHRFPQQSLFEQKLYATEVDYLMHSPAGRQTLAENYVGLPF